MRLAAIATLTALSAAALAACSHPTPTPYTNTDWGFSATFQAPPKVTETKASATASHSLLVDSSAFGDDFSVNVVDAGGPTSSADQVLNAAPNALSQSMGIDVGAVTYVATQGVTGREVRFDRSERPVMLMRIYFAGGKLYEVSADAAKGVTDPAAKAFLDSFKLTNPPPPPLPEPAANAADSNATNTATNAAG
ncbi:MAG TPA: hypothetical protein VGL58_14165 [Caulobacteraceae bacterium]|jgi:hypothetical protein